MPPRSRSTPSRRRSGSACNSAPSGSGSSRPVANPQERPMVEASVPQPPNPTSTPGDTATIRAPAAEGLDEIIDSFVDGLDSDLGKAFRTAMVGSYRLGA